MVEASYWLLANARLTPPRSTARSKPTRSRILSTALAISLTTINPMIRMRRKATSLGAKVAISRHMSLRASLTMRVLL